MIKTILKHYKENTLTEFSLNLTKKENLILRKYLFTLSDKKAQRAIRHLCSESYIFFINLFLWLHHPTAKNDKVRPFILYDFQVDQLIDNDECLEVGKSQVIVKTREMGLSWTQLAWVFHRWKFRHDETFLLGSRVELLVDNKGDMKALMQKLDFLENDHPKYLKLRGFKKNRRFLSMYNPETNSSITGTSTNGELGRGGRYTMVLLDEVASMEKGRSILAALVSVSPYVCYLSTVKGTDNIFYDLAHNPAHSQIRHHWTKHPVYSQGLEYIDGKPTSPWYESRCLAIGDPIIIAREIDMNFQTSSYQFFSQELIDTLLREIQPPIWAGEIVTIKNRQELLQSKNGMTKIWEYTQSRHKYVIGCDISMGSGASNSSASVVNMHSGEKVCELTSPILKPHQFAKAVIDLAKYYNDALIIPESNGPGLSFISELLSEKYFNIYNYTAPDKISNKASKTLGWHSNKDEKYSLFFNYQKALRKKLFINKSKYAISELSQYEYSNRGDLEHVGSRMQDPTGARSNHGDRVIADALACKYFLEMQYPQVKESREVDPTTPIGRILAKKEKKVKKW